MGTASFYNTKPHPFHSPLPFNKNSKPSPRIVAPIGLRLKTGQQAKHIRGLCSFGCVALSSSSVVAELKRELEVEMNPEEEEEWMRLGRLRDKYKERKGVVELLECLEREAIMGDDEGKEPTDYNRRAQIFDKSSRVFQALKELDNNTIIQNPP